MAPEALLRINLFEPLRVQLGDRPPIDEYFARRRAKALFAYLYLKRGRQISKYQLLADLWPDAEHADPGRVKHTVQVLRAALEGPRPAGGWRVIQERGGFYFFNTALERYSDVEDFEEQLRLGRLAQQTGQIPLALDHYRRAIALHRGAFLSEYRYDDWAAADIARENELYLAALQEGARLESTEGNYSRAIDLLRTAIYEDPLHERSHVELMRVLWLDGQRTEALRAYRHMREILAQRLQGEPQAQTTRLYEAIRRDEAVAM